MIPSLAVRLTFAVALAGTVQAGAPRPPQQPASGPGGRDYVHGDVRTTSLGTGARQVFVFEPARPRPAGAPVVVFTHGWMAMNPTHYGAWITHIVRRGYTVVYPRYQVDARTPVAEFTGHALAGVKHALDFLRTEGRVAPDPRGLAFVGHSMGGLVATNLAVHAARGELPAPRALMVVTPGKTWPESSPIAFKLDDLSTLPESLLLLAVVGNDDDFVREIDARKVYSGAVNVAAENKNYVRVYSDDRGQPSLVADHRFPAAPGFLPGFRTAPGRGEADEDSPRGPLVTNALDYFGTWKLFDGLADAAFHGMHREYALGNTPEQRHMGYWSDRTPVRELIVETP